MTNNEFIEKNYDLIKLCINFKKTKYNCRESLKDNLLHE